MFTQKLADPIPFKESHFLCSPFLKFYFYWLTTLKRYIFFYAFHISLKASKIPSRDYQEFKLEDRSTAGLLYLHDKYDIAASAAPRCIAVQHIAAF